MSKNVLVLRTCKSDMTSRGGFVWPQSGPVECPVWNAAPECGNGLHGLLWGEGDGTLLYWDEDAKWLVVEVAEEQIVDLGRKVKFPRGEVVYCGDQKGATQLIQRPGRAVAGGMVTAGDYGIATVGDYGTATAGYGGIATTGYGGTATAGDYGTATAGDRGTATAGYGGTATAGHFGMLIMYYLDGTQQRVVGQVGQDGILPDRPYRVVGGKLVEK